MFGIEKRMNSRIVSFFRRRGFDAAIGRVKWRGGRLTLDGVLLKKNDDSEQGARVERLDIGLHVWRSLFHFAWEGELKMEGICCDLRAVSDRALSFQTMETAFRFGKKRQIAQMDTAGVSLVLQRNRGKTYDDFYLQIPPTAWDDLLGVIRPYLLCPWVKNARSADELSFLAHFRRGKSPEVPYSLEAKIDTKGLSLAFDGQNVRIDRDFLAKVLTDKRNADYIPFERLSGNLVNAFICTEDPQFRQHKGVSPYFIGYAIRENLQRRKIARGASTITMQVARNLFLNHNRNLLRKAEETIIALLLENYYKIDKRTIFELYANLIEFAPGVYGVADASRFYFDKDVCELSLTEILTLTYIIPRPLHFYQALLDRTGQLQRNLRNHIGTYASAMINRGFISLSDLQSLDYNIRFSQQFGTLDLSQQV